ncbi:hypothetical protein [Henriciella sp.]|uniref:hypothetical protein n=1 Tax=Henriciella sp. TaxID=1968823 RepID=UPI002605DF4A|nr:hypothetical protein [Henriciella sp.]
MTLFSKFFSSPLMQAPGLASEQAVPVNTANTEMIAGRASEVVSLGVFPVEVAFVVLGCLIISSFALLIRETRIEQRQG